MDYGLRTEENEGALHGDFQNMSEGLVWAVVLSVEIPVTGFLDEFVALPDEELGRICFLKGEIADDLNAGGED